MASNAWRDIKNPAWKKIRDAVIRRDGECLLRYSPKCNGHAEAVHHTQDRRLVGDNPAYLIATCHPCNQSYGSPTDEKHNNPTPRPRTNW